MANKANMKKYCGGYDAYWTIDEHPTADEIGVFKDIEVFGTHNKGTTYNINHILKFQLLRCSEAANDFVYKFVGTYNNHCNDAMCGTDSIAG